MTQLPPLDAMTLRRLGETADGGRDRDMKLVLVTDDNGGLAYDVVSTQDISLEPTKYQPVADVKPIQTSVASVPLVAFDHVAFIKGERAIACCERPTDALFWTDSAMEKFVFPYYEQVRIFPEDYLKELKADFRNDRVRENILAIQHRDPSRSTKLARGSCSPPPEADEFGLSYLAPQEADSAEYRWYSLPDFRKRYR